MRALLLAGLAALLVAAPASAETWTVTDGSSDTPSGCNADTRRCPSLRAAIAASEATKEEADTIIVPAGTISVNDDLVIQSEMTIVGTSARTNIIDGNGKYRGFRVTASGIARISHFTIRNGAAGQGSQDGGGILNQGGTVTLDTVRVTASQAVNGGGIANVRGNLAIARGLVDNNTASLDGGGIANIGGPETPDFDLLAVADTTVFRNTGGRGGVGGISSRNAGSIVSIVRSTVSDNTGAAVGGIGLSHAERVAVGSSVVARNRVGTATSNCGDLKPIDNGGNVENEKECDFDVQGVASPVAAELSNQGGEVNVLALTAASPAVDLAPLAACNQAGVTDARGLARPQGPRCDAGAFELDQAPTVTINSGPTGTINSSNASFTFSATEPGVSFQCRLTGPGQPGVFTPCDKPDAQAYGGLASGNYQFSVRALDGAFADPPVASRSFTVVLLDTTITGGPSGFTNDATPTFTFTGVGGATSFQCRVDAAAFTACTSPHTTAALGQGAHTFEVRALGATGAPDPTPASRSFTVDTIAPNTTITSAPASPGNDSTPTFTFTSNEAGSTFQCRVDAAAFTSCTSPYTTPPLGDGEHAVEIRAVNAAGTPDASPASVTFVVDTTPPAPPAVVSGPQGPTTDSAPAFAFTAAERVTCRLDGPGGRAGTFGACRSPVSFGTLAPGAYVFIVRSVDAAGNASEARRAFTVSVPQQATPTPAPTVTPAQTPAPTPAPTPDARNAVVEPATGTILIRRKGSRTFEPLTAGAAIPYGSEVDARKGRVTLTSLPRAGAAPESADFFAGLFTVHKAGQFTELRLSEKLTGCKKTKRASTAQKKKRKPKTRKLWGEGKGKFRTKGQYSSATIRGTRWLVQDGCTTTLTRVTQGVVAVRDFGKRKTVLVKKGKRYTARPKRR